MSGKLEFPQPTGRSPDCREWTSYRPTFTGHAGSVSPTSSRSLSLESDVTPRNGNVKRAQEQVPAPPPPVIEIVWNSFIRRLRTLVMCQMVSYMFIHGVGDDDARNIGRHLLDLMGSDERLVNFLSSSIFTNCYQSVTHTADCSVTCCD